METVLRELRPGDLIVDRYMPGATQEDRDAARANLYAFAAVLLRCATRRANEEYESEIRASAPSAVESDCGGTPPL
jgi:hypothetical protein